MMRGGGLLGRADIKPTLIYAHLSPAHLRSEVAKTERTVERLDFSARLSARDR
jgi:hypothetical protein